MAAVSEYARERQRAANRELYHAYTSRGICPRCKTEWGAAGHVYCTACLKVHREYNDRYDSEYKKQKCRERRERLKAQGLCVSCGKKAVEGRVLCAKCARRNSEAQQVRKMRKRLQKEELKNGNGDNTGHDNAQSDHADR